MTYPNCDSTIFGRKAANELTMKESIVEPNTMITNTGLIHTLFRRGRMPFNLSTSEPSWGRGVSCPPVNLPGGGVLVVHQ